MTAIAAATGHRDLRPANTDVDPRFHAMLVVDTMYKRRTPGAKRDPIKQWALPDRVFFAAGACHILGHAFLESNPNSGFAPMWIRPRSGHTGNHIVLVRNGLVFDYHGFSEWDRYWAHTMRRANQWWPGWSADIVGIRTQALVSRYHARDYDGLWMKEPHEYLGDPIARARAYLRKFTVPLGRGDT